MSSVKVRLGASRQRRGWDVGDGEALGWSSWSPNSRLKKPLIPCYAGALGDVIAVPIRTQRVNIASGDYDYLRLRTHDTREMGRTPKTLAGLTFQGRQGSVAVEGDGEQDH